MTEPKAIDIGDDIVEAYRRDGVVCLRGVIEAKWIEILREGVEKDLAEPGPHVEIFTKESDPGLFFNDFYLWRRIPELKQFAFHGPMAGVAGRLMGASQVNFFYDHVFVKEPGTEGLTHWHQDQPYMAVDGVQFCSTWVPLDPITKDTCVEYVRGSHRWGRWFAPFDRLTDGKRYEGTNFERCPDIEARRDEYDIVYWEMEPGDCLVFQALMVHQGRPNLAKSTRRRSVTHRWLGDDATYSVREPPSEFPHDEPELKHGEPMRNSPDYPMIWKSAA